MEIKNVELLTYSQVKELIENSEKTNLRAQKVKELLNKFKLVDPEKVEEFKEELKSLEISRLKDKERAFISIINFLPSNEEELRSILAGENVTLALEDLKKILDVVKKYSK